jgi:hypothetical protein
MSSDEALASRAKRLSAWQADRAALLEQADAFVVVSWWQEKSSDGRTGDYEYEHRPTLNDALDTYPDYEDGEFRRARRPSASLADKEGPCRSAAGSRPCRSWQPDARRTAAGRRSPSVGKSHAPPAGLRASWISSPSPSDCERQPFY